MQVRDWAAIAILSISAGLAADFAAGQGSEPDPRVVSPIKTQIEASDAVRRRVDRYFIEAVKKRKDGCDLDETTINELEYFSTEGGVNASADVEYGRPVAFSNEFMESLKDYAKFRLKEFKEICPPPGDTQTAQRQESGAPTEKSDPEPFSPPGGLRARLGGPQDGMTSIDPPKGSTSAKDGAAGAIGTGKLIATLQGPGGHPIIVVEDSDGKRWISTDGGKTKNYFQIDPAPERQAKADAPTMHRKDMSGGVKRPANALQGGGDADKKDGVMRAQEAVEESNRKIGMIQRDLRELAGTENPKDAILNTQGRISDLDKQIEGVEGVLVRAGVTQDELKAMKEEWEGEWVLQADDFIPTSPEKLARWLGARHAWAERLVPYIGLAGNVATWLGRKVFKEIDIAKFEQYIEQGQIQKNTAIELLSGLYLERGIELSRLRELRGLQKRLTNAQNDAAKAYARLGEETKRRDLLSGSAASNAMLGRAMDNEGDAQLQRESSRDAVREGIKLAPGQKPVTSKSPTITNKKPSSTAAKSAPAQRATSVPAPNNELGQQIMQGLIQGGIQYGLGQIGGGRGHRQPAHQPAARTSGGGQNPQGATNVQQAAPAPSGGAGKSYLFQGFTVNPGR